MERKVCEMRVFTAELKRLLKTRSILILMLAALLLAPVLAYFPASFASWTYKDDSGQEIRAEGKAALKLEAKNQGPFQERSPKRSWLQLLQGTWILPQDTRAVYRTAFMMKG